MQGIWIAVNGSGLRRPKSKKEVKEACKQISLNSALREIVPGAEDIVGGMGDAKLEKAMRVRVLIEATSIFGNEYDGRVEEMPDGHKVLFVGPDPARSRRFYGSIERHGHSIMVK